VVFENYSKKFSRMYIISHSARENRVLLRKNRAPPSKKAPGKPALPSTSLLPGSVGGGGLLLVWLAKLDIQFAGFDVVGNQRRAVSAAVVGLRHSFLSIRAQLPSLRVIRGVQHFRGRCPTGRDGAPAPPLAWMVLPMG
jgi:hypothetical protein